jgi:hypothetical protein
MARIDEVRKPNAIVSTNTSGIPVTSIAEGRSKEFKKHFLGTHFFNPPRYLKLLEVIPTKDTAKEVVEFISHFGEYRLGKGIVLCKDTPNFIGNRVAFGTGAFAMDFILKNDYSVDEVDAVTGPIDRATEDRHVPLDRPGRAGCMGSRGAEPRAVDPARQAGTGISQGRSASQVDVNAARAQVAG